jgi:hypothetical protein
MQCARSVCKVTEAILISGYTVARHTGAAHWVLA